MAAAVIAARQNIKRTKSVRQSMEQRVSHGGFIACLDSHEETDQVSTYDFPVSFHLQLHLGAKFKHENMSSVQLLRLPLKAGSSNFENPASSKNEGLAKAAGTKFELFTKKCVPRIECGGTYHEYSGSEFHEELLIATERRLFMVPLSSALLNQTDDPDFWTESEKLEIVESIPLEEVQSICISQGDKWHGDTSDRNSYNLEWVYGLFRTCFIRKNEEMVKVPCEINKEENHLLDKNRANDAFEGFLRLQTKPDGFNRGRSFYFMIDKKYYRSRTKRLPKSERDATNESGTSCGAAAAPLELVGTAEAPPPAGRSGFRRSVDAVRQSFNVRNSVDRSPDRSDDRNQLELVFKKLSTLARRRKAAYRREYRFQLLQESLQAVWNSIPFNACVLVLIVSNFAFTVQQLENKDPSKQPFYETIDLVYTIIFSAGNSPNP
jgi:hypothetical protein